MSYEISEQKDFSLPSPAPKYPHGLKISLGKEELKKLNIDGTPQVGQKYKAEIEVEVVEVSAEMEEGDQKEHRVQMQIKQMALKKEKEDDMGAATVIYGG